MASASKGREMLSPVKCFDRDNLRAGRNAVYPQVITWNACNQAAYDGSMTILIRSVIIAHGETGNMAGDPNLLN